MEKPLHICDNVTFSPLALRFCLSGPPEDRLGFAYWLGRASCKIVETPAQADIVVFTGGPDVNPSLYRDVLLPCSYVDDERDKADLALYEECVSEGIPMLGICRGSQFLWTRLGGQLFQDVDKHNDGAHDIMLLKEKKRYRASSVHHQMARPGSVQDVQWLATAVLSESRKTGTHEAIGPNSDLEIWACQKKGILGIQGHPEYPGFPSYSEMCLRMIEEYLYDNEATVYRHGKLRLAAAYTENA